MMDLELARQIVELLNEAVNLDPEAMHSLVEARVRCNKELGGHPTIQVRDLELPDGTCEVGLLGILNGICGVDDQSWGPIAAVYKDPPDGSNGKDLGVLLRFEVREKTH